MKRAQTSILDEIIVDNFAGGGGASTGMELALGRPVDIAINHDPAAILMHQTNHPYTEHFQASVWDIDPRTVCRGRPVGLAWFSPDCKHFSNAKGGKPVDKNIRGLAWIALRWAGLVWPRVIILENVEEFQTWGPVRRGKPIKSKQGQTFRRFIQQLRDLGYDVEWRELVAADYGIFMVGGYGTGKTHLAAAIANSLIKDGTPVICMTMIDMLARIKETFDRDTEASEAEVMRLYTEVPLLVIDDLGSEQPTEWGSTTIFSIINARYEGYMPTIVTSNCGADELVERMTPAGAADRNAQKTVDRLREMCVGLQMDWPSWRQK